MTYPSKLMNACVPANLQDSMVELRDCNSSSNSASLGGSIFMSRSDFVLAKCQFSGDLVSLLPSLEAALSFARQLD